MENEHVDPLYEYVDAKVEAILAEQKKALLQTQRILADFMIISDANAHMRSALEQKPKLGSAFVTQLTAKVATARTRVETSFDPLALASDFQGKCHEERRKLGMNVIEV